ncbi:MAG: hypothetical protein QHI48_08315, partial [Bacteroidota bacterium]|nr:hypothetical protein [Bacteroidota bacterium]
MSMLCLGLAGFVCRVSAQAPTWEKRYGLPERTEFAFDAAERPDGGFVLCGFKIGSDIWDCDGWVAAIDRLGDTLWTRRIGTMGFGAGADLLTSLVVDGDGDCLITGSKYRYSTRRGLWLVKFGADGTLLQDRMYDGPDEDNGHIIAADGGGRYIVVGDTRSYGSQSGGKDVWLLLLDGNGDTIRTMTFDFGAEDMGTAVLPRPDGTYLVTAVCCTANCGGMLQEGFSVLFLADSVGNILSLEKFDVGPKNKLMSISASPDGGILLVGSTSRWDEFPAEDVWLTKKDASFRDEWVRTYGMYGRYDGGIAAVPTADGGWFVAAYSQTFQSPGMNFDNWWLLRLDAKGDTLWTRWWGGPLNDDRHSICATSDGGLLIAGWFDANSNPLYGLSIGNSDVYVVKAGPDGSVNGIPHVSMPSCRAKVYITPHPIREEAFLRCSEQTDGAEFLVRDALGREAARIACFGDVAVFRKGSLPAGVYLLQLVRQARIL